MRAGNYKWAFRGKDPESIANRRVCLALLRMFRNVPMNISERDHDDIGEPFWPAVREVSPLVRKALQKRRAAQKKRKNQAETPAHWDELISNNDFPVVPESDFLTTIGEALVQGWPEFQDVFDTIEKMLAEPVMRERMPSDDNVELLARALNFTSAERAYLGLASAREQSTIEAGLFARPQSTTSRIAALQQALHHEAPHDVRDLLTMQGNLERSGLFHRSPSVHFDLQDNLVLSRKGSTLINITLKSPENMAALVLKSLPDSKSSTKLEWPHLQEKTNLIEHLLANSLAQETRGINILLYGTPGTGKTEFALSLVNRLQAKGYQIEDTDDDGAPASRQERLSSLQLSQTFAPAGKSILVLDEAEDIFQTDYHQGTRAHRRDEPSKSWMNHLLENNRVPVIWISNRIGHMDPAYLRRFSYCLEFPPTPRLIRRNIAKAYLEPVGCSDELVSAMASSEHISPALFASAARVISLAGAQGRAVDAIARNVLTDHLNAVGIELPAHHVPPRATRFDLAYLNVRGNFSAADVLAAVQRTGKGTLLLGGPPGTGKTQLAAEIAERLGRELVYKTAADINSMWYGESERNVARMFTDSDPRSEVLFLDEADTLLGSREASGHRADKAVTAEFLRRVEAFDGIFVCATNHSTDFDAAMMRRFMFRLNFQPLTMEQRIRLLCECALGWKPDSGAERPELETSLTMRLNKLDQLTPGDFANVVKRVRALQLQLTTAEWLDELHAEHASKSKTSAASIGFL